MAWLSLLFAAAIIKSTSTSCLLTREGGVRTKFFEELVCPDEYDYEEECDENQIKTKKIQLGPSTEWHCLNSSWQELSDLKAPRDSKYDFFVTQSSFGVLTPDEKSWPHLTELTLDEANVTQIVPGFFNGFTDLTLLSMPRNNITDIVDGVFSGLTNLVHLNLSYNSISHMGSLSLVGLFRLSVLDLRRNKIKALPPKLLITQFQVTHLDLSGNLLEQQPADISASSFQQIILSNNALSGFRFSNITNRYTRYDGPIIDLSINNITIIENFETFNGSAVDISFNRLKALTRTGQVETINISHNLLEMIGNNFIGNTVVCLDLSFNFIQSISSNAFLEGTSLQILSLNNNKLRQLDSGHFKNQQFLDRLDLSHNDIFNFEFGVFNNLRFLTYLNISSNEGVVDFQALFRLSRLKVLDFERNQPKNLDEFFFDTHRDLRTIRMGYNAWSCEELAKAIHLMEIRHITVLRGLNDDAVHIHGIECNNSKGFANETKGQDNGALNGSIVTYCQERASGNSAGVVLSLVVCNVLLLLIFCSLIFVIRRRRFESIRLIREQLELME